MLRISSIVVAAGLALASLPAAAHGEGIEVKDAWIRGTVPGQSATGAFMNITSKGAARLVGASSPAAAKTEIHNMTMEGGVMKMSEVDDIKLPAHRTVKLAPGGFHVMLLDLKQTLKAGDRVPLKLTFELAGKKRETLELSVEVRAVTGEKMHMH